MADHLPHVPGYVIRQVLGRGGFATVYEAQQLSFERPVALKILNAAAVDEAAARRFRAECRTVGELSWHPNVVPVFDAGATPDGHLYLAMELVTRGSWGDRSRREGAIDPEVVRALGVQLAEALAAAHAAGIVHRDVKPDNVLIGRADEALLTDFGIARQNDDQASATGSPFIGTLAYSAPELLMGASATPSSDVFSLGATLHALLLGRAGFSATDDESPGAVINRVLKGAVEPLPPTIPADLRSILERAMDADPARRLTAAELAAGLRSGALRAGSAPVATGAGVTAASALGPPAPPADASVEPSARRGRAPVVLGVVGFVVVLALGAGILAMRSGDDSPSSDSPSTTESAAASDTTTTEAAPASETFDLGLDESAPSSLAVGGGSVWVAGGFAPTLVRLDAENGEVESQISLGTTDDIQVNLVAFGADAAWVTVDRPSGTTLTKIDPQTDEVVGEIPFDEAYVIAIQVVESTLWLSVAQGSTLTPTLERFDAVTLERTARQVIPSRADDILVAGSDVWASLVDLNQVIRLTQSDLTIEATIAVGTRPGGLTGDGDAVWVLNEADENAMQIDPQDDRVVGVVDLVLDTFTIAGGSDGLWIGRGAITDVVELVDPASGETLREVDGGDLPVALVPDGDDLWILSQGDGTVIRVRLGA